MRNDFSLKLQTFGYTVYLVCPGSDWSLSVHTPHPTPPQPPAPYSLPGSQTHCHSFHVRFLVRSERSLRHRCLLFLLRGSGLCCFFGTLVRARINFWHDTLLVHSDLHVKCGAEHAITVDVTQKFPHCCYNYPCCWLCFGTFDWTRTKQPKEKRIWKLYWHKVLLSPMYSVICWIKIDLKCSD